MSALLQRIWQSIRDEAKLLAEQEPSLASFFHSTILTHQHLGTALSYILANKLSARQCRRFHCVKIIDEVYRENPKIIESAAHDIEAVRVRDPAVGFILHRCFI